MFHKPSTNKIVAYFGDREFENNANNLAKAIGEGLEHFEWEYHPDQLLIWCEFQIKRKFQYSKSVEKNFKKPAIGAYTISRDLRTYLDSPWYEEHLKMKWAEEESFQD